RDLELVHGLDKYRRQLAGYGMLLSEILKDQPVSICKVAIFPYILGSDPVAQAISEVNQDEDISLIFAENMEWDCSLEMLFGPPMLKKLRMPEFEEVLHLLNPIRVFEHNFVTDLDIAQRRIKSFDKEQMKYLERIKSEGHYIINGL